MGFLNCLAGLWADKRFCGPDPRIMGKLGGMHSTILVGDIGIQWMDFFFSLLLNHISHP